MRGILLALGIAVMAAPAQAGDTAEAEVFGFSEGSRLFAFEEFGVQDGSGFPYASIYVVDVDTDRWVGGTPIRVVLESETASLGDARTQAEARLRAQFGDVFEHARATTLAHSPLGEIDSDPTRLAFAPVLPSLPLGTPDRRYVARLDIFHAEAATANCVTVIGDRPVGFRLTVERQGGGSVVLSEDDTIPRSRGCPITYRLSQIVVPDWRAERVTILVSVFRPGFEGPQRRFIAVTGRLPE